MLNKDDILRIHKSASCLHSSSRSSVCQEKTQNAVCVKILCRHNPKNRVWIVVLLWWEQVTAVPLYSHTEQKPMHFWYKNYHFPTKQCENNWNVYDKNRPVKNKSTAMHSCDGAQKYRIPLVMFFFSVFSKLRKGHNSIIKWSMCFMQYIPNTLKPYELYMEKHKKYDYYNIHIFNII